MTVVFLAVTIVGIILLCFGLLTLVLADNKNQRKVRRENLIGNLLATASAPYSWVSRAIFWASITSPATIGPSGRKHQPTEG